MWILWLKININFEGEYLSRVLQILYLEHISYISSCLLFDGFEYFYFNLFYFVALMFALFETFEILF